MPKVGDDALREVTIALRQWEYDVTESDGLKQSSKQTYIDYAREFVRWLNDDFQPGAGRGSTK